MLVVSSIIINKSGLKIIIARVNIIVFTMIKRDYSILKPVYTML